MPESAATENRRMTDYCKARKVVTRQPLWGPSVYRWLDRRWRA